MTSETAPPSDSLEAARASAPGAARGRVGVGVVRRPARVPRSTIALLFISILLPLFLFALAANQNRRDVVTEAAHRVERTTRILHEHALKVFETHQLMLDQINERLATIDWSNPRDAARMHDMLAHLKALLPQVANILIMDANGKLRADSLTYPADQTLNFSDRDYFQALKAAPQTLPFISRAMISRANGEPIFTMTTRVRGPDPDKFYGVLSIGLKRGYFSDFYSDIEHEYAHVVVLARTDGEILASEPKMARTRMSPENVARLAEVAGPANVPINPTMIDGAKRLVGFEKVGAYPVVIGFGITWDSALAPWWRNMMGYGLVAGLSSLTLLGVSGFAIRRITLEGRATMRWRRSAALLESEMAERIHIEEQLRQSQKMEAVGRLTGGIAHDFNNLLTVVIGSLDLLSRRMKDADPRHLALVTNAMDGASRAATLTGRLLAFSRQHPLAPQAIDVNTLINGMSNLLLRTLGETVSVEFMLAGDLAKTWVDPNQLENAILNLCVNAVDAMPKGGTLTLTTANMVVDPTQRHAGLETGAYVEIAVTDTGTGMPANVVAHAFEPFFTTKPVGKGTGLGLSQVYGFAQQSGGDAEIVSELGRGTTIRIHLPQRVAAMGPVEIIPPPIAPAANDSLARPSGGTTILIVEDDDLVRKFSSTALREAGYTIVEAGTGPEGLRALEANPEIALLFTDVVLKGPMNGRELADLALAANPSLPVLFTTGYTKDAIVHHGHIDEGVNLLTKPFTTAVLAAKIADLLQPAAIEDRRSATG